MKQIQTREGAWEYRVVKPNGIFKAIMSAYGNQHEISTDLLARNGLHAFVVVPDPSMPEKFRLASPWEFASAMGLGTNIVLPNAVVHAWKMVGNALAPCQALMACLRCHNLFGSLTPFHPQIGCLAKFALHMRKFAIKLSLWKQQVDGEWRFLVYDGNSPVFGAEPQLERDNHEISPTVEYAVEEACEISPQLKDDELRTLVAFGKLPINNTMWIDDLFESAGAHIHIRCKHSAWAITTHAGTFVQAGWVEERRPVWVLLRKVWPHIQVWHIDSIAINQQEACWDDLLPAVDRIGIIVKLTLQDCEVRFFAKGIKFQVGVDCSWTVGDLKAFVGTTLGLLPSQLIVIQDQFQWDNDEFISHETPMHFEIRQATNIDGRLEIIQKRSAVAIPPTHSDQCIGVGCNFVRYSVRHPVWGTVRTTSVPPDFTIQQSLQVLLPDFNAEDIGIQGLTGNLPLDTTVDKLTCEGEWYVWFRKEFPLQTLQTAAAFRPLTLPEFRTMAKRWIRTPFNHRATPMDLPGCWTLVQLVATQFLSTNCTQTVICLVGGKHVDPRLRVDQIPEDAVITIRACPLPGGAKKSNLHSKLRQVLVARGVPDSGVDKRIENIVANISPGKLHEIESEEDEQFWQHLKQLASQVHVRLVTATELRDFQKLKRVTARTSEPASSSSNVPKKAAAEGGRLPKLDDLTFDSSHFVACGATVDIIPAQKYGPDACGVAVMTVEQARKHVDDGVISVDPLAILAVGHQEHLLGTLLQVPAFRKNGMPLIVPACLIQCGDESVEFQANIPSAETPTVEAVTMEFTLKRTHVDDWSTTATPTHYLGLQCPELRGPGKILASWSIKPFKDRKVCMHSEADSWHGYLKLDLTLTAQVLKRSGFNGIFFTPRGIDKKPHGRFAVVPLPGTTLDKVQKHASEVANTLGVAVLGNKFDTFGIRCRKEHHDELRAHFFPESIKVDTDQIKEGDMLYTIKHLNAQYNREAMNLALDAVGWAARAIRANGPGSWLIASSDAPPSEHLCLNGSLAVVVGKKLTKPQALVMTRTAVDMQVTSAQDGSVTVNKQTRVDEIKADVSEIIDDKMQVATQQIQMLRTALEDTQQKLSNLEKGTQQELNKIREDGAETRGKLGDMEQLIQANAGTLIGQMKELLDGFHRDSGRQNQTFQQDLKSQIGTMQTDLNSRIDAIEREQGKRHKGAS